MAKIDKHGKPSAGQAKQTKEKDKAGRSKDENREPSRPAALAGTWRADFDAADKNRDGKLAKSELKLAEADPKTFDADADGSVSKQEFHAGFRKANSFDGLDADGDGALNQDELGKLRRFNDTAFDGDGDGNVTAQEFETGRRAENAARRLARHDAAFEALTKKDEKSLERYDADGDGDISKTEYHAGRDQDRAKAVSGKIAANFAKAGGKDGVMKADALHKAYDADGDGTITTDEFDAGQRADRSAYWSSVLTKGGADKVVARRLDLDALGLGVNRLPGDTTGANDGPPGTANGKATELVISSFNVLGSSHTRPGHSERPGMAVGTTRIKQTAQLLDKHKVDIVGFQEFQPDQVKAFQKVAGDKYALYPGMKLGRGPNVNSIAWRKDTWDLVKADTVPIPYFGGHPVKMPFVRLRNKQTGQEVYIANFHNPASTRKHPGNAHWRDVATRKEIELVNRLSKQSGLPVFLTGDLNERAEAYNKITRGAAMSSADEGPNGKRPRHMGIDWIFGTEGVDFSHYVRDDGALVDRASDHPMIVSRAKIRKRD